MKTFLTSLLLFLPLLARAEQKIDLATLKHPVKACLFKVEGNGLKKTSYLFGTLHLGDKRVVTLHPNAETAFKGADAFYAEIDLDPAAQMKVAPLLMRRDGKKLTAAIGPELTAKLKKALKSINPALDTTTLEHFKTWAVAVTVPILELQLKMEQPLDAVLYARAQKANKKVGALETADSQMGVFDKFTEKEQQTLLNDSLDAMLEDEDGIQRLLRTYLTGSTKEIAEFMTKEMATLDSNPDLAKRLMKALLDDRNIGMADNADKFMQADPDKSHFFAVGAAHYTGKTAVQDLLEKKGYKITPFFK